MFLRSRSLQAEYFDAPERTAEELRSHYTWLNRVNRLTRFERPFTSWIPRLLGSNGCQQLQCLDVGAGDGALGRALSAHARSQGWDWQFTDLDLSPHACSLNPNPRATVGSAAALPFTDRSFDVVIANTMTHHLPDDATVITHFREAARVARRLVLICDMQRNPAFLALLSTLLWLRRAPRDFRADGILSVRRGWKRREWEELAQRAGLTSARVWTEHGARILLAVTVQGQDR